MELSMTDVPDSESIVIPAELMGKIPLPLGLPSSYRVVSGAVEQFNQATGTKIDPISVAEALVKKGYMINFIPERRVEIQPTEAGLILDTKQILQVLSDDRLAEFPILARAIEIIHLAAPHENGTLQSAFASLGTPLLSRIFGDKEPEPQDPRAAAENYLRSETKFFLRYSEHPVAAEEMENIAPLVVEQAVFIFDNIEKMDQLRTKEQQRRWERRHEIAREADRRARQGRREELFESREAAERWLFGVARGALRDAKESVEDAARDLAQSKRAPELIAHHVIDLFDFTDRQIAAIEERERRKEIWRIEGPIAVLLTAFAKPRVVDDSQPMVRKNPGDHMYRLVTLWLDAKFVRELPGGAYNNVLHSERQYQERYRNRMTDDMRRDSFYGLGRGERDNFSDEIARDEKARGDAEMHGYESSRVATLWWKCPLWLQWKILRPHIGDELRKVANIVRGYNAKQFLSHIDELIGRENRVIKLQNLVLGTIEKPDKGTIDQYWKEIMETGAPSISRLEALANAMISPTQERAEAIIKASRDRIKDLGEMRDYVNLDFVMSREQREAEIERQQKERARWQLPRLSGLFR